MKLRTWSLSNLGVMVIATLLTALVLVESIFPPWAPYFIIYAALAIAIPLTLRTYRFGSFGTVMKSHWKLILVVFVIAVVWDEGISTWLYERILASLGLGANPFYSLNAALAALAETAARKFDITSYQAMLLYAMFILIWAPVGEELFYRGYIQGVLRGRLGFKASALVSAAFFGLRHATHLFFLWPHVPLMAAASWVIGAFVFGLLMSYLYEKTDSLVPPILVHFGVNLFEIVLSL
jgi:membrane protease YdiL (CAAX protease family)